MKRFLTKWLVGVGLALAVIQGSLNAAQSQFVASTNSASQPPAILSGIPFHGKIASLDVAARVVAVDCDNGKRTFEIAPDAKIMNGEWPAKLRDFTVGDEVRGEFTKSDDGRMILKLLYLIHSAGKSA